MEGNRGVIRRPSTGDGRRWGKGQQIVGGERQILAEELVERYSDGASIRTLASSLGRSYGFVHRVLSESGVTLRPRGGSPGRRRPRSTEQE